MVNEYNVVLAPYTEGHPVLVKEQSTSYDVDTVNSPKSIVDLVNACTRLAWRAEEYIYMVAMDTAGHVLGLFELSHGTVNTAPAGMREIAIRAILSGAICVAILHNHPSGDLKASHADEHTCRHIQEACALLEIKLVDFIIVGRGHNAYYSFAEEHKL